MNKQLCLGIIVSMTFVTIGALTPINGTEFSDWFGPNMYNIL